MSALRPSPRKRVKVALDLNTMLYCVVTVPDLMQLTNPARYKDAQRYKRQIQDALDRSQERQKVKP